MLPRPVSVPLGRLAALLAPAACAAAAGACGPSSHVTHFPPVVVVPPAAAPAAQTVPGARPRGVLSSVCGDRHGCRVVDRRAAGVDAEGRRVEVVTALAAALALDPPAAVSLVDEPSAEGGDEAGGAAPGALTEYWAVALDGGQVVSAQLLAELDAAEGEGGRGGEVAVAENAFHLARRGDPNRPWEERTELRLWPLGPRSWSRKAWSPAGPAGAATYEEEAWDWDEFRGRAVWFEAVAGAPAPPEGAPRAPEPAGASFAYEPLPAVALDATYVTELWRETGLGRCALRADGGAGGGFALLGRADGAGDSSLRAVFDAEATALYVEVFDDRWVGPGGAADDRLEVLVEAPASEPGAPCAGGAAAGRVTGWSIRAVDGALVGPKPRPGAGGAARVEHARAAGGHSVRLKVTLPGAPGGAVTLVYHDTDDGRRVERSFASSRLRRGDARSLGRVRAVGAREARCRPRDGALEPELAASFDPTEPVIGAVRPLP
jgi:hypothetical protein